MTGLHSLDLLELDWAEWIPLDAGSFTDVPKQPGRKEFNPKKRAQRRF